MAAVVEDIKKAIIYADQLQTGDNYIRFRIISENKLELSHWSRVYKITKTVISRPGHPADPYIEITIE